jgi:hypothetical protein
MCIACEMEFWLAIDEPPPDARVPAQQAAPFVCDAPDEALQAAAPSPQNERKPIVRSRE